MIIFIIVITLFVLCLVWLLWGRWEITNQVTYTYNKEGKRMVEAKDLKEYQTDPNLVLSLLKEKYPEKYKQKYNYNTQYYPHKVDSETLDDLKYCQLPCDMTTKKKVVLERYYDLEEKIGALVCGGIVLLALIIMTSCAIGARNPWSVQSKETSINERIVELENNKFSLLSYYETGVGKDIDISSSNLPKDIRDHNADVADLAKTIKTCRIDASNPWINWWTNPAYANVDLVRVEGDPNNPNDSGLYINLK